MYGFFDEWCKKFGNLRLWRDCVEVFDFLPIAAKIDNKLLAVHGGLSPDAHALSDIQKIDRRQTVPTEGPLCDLLWSDPSEEEGWVNTQEEVKNIPHAAIIKINFLEELYLFILLQHRSCYFV